MRGEMKKDIWEAEKLKRISKSSIWIVRSRLNFLHSRWSEIKEFCGASICSHSRQQQYFTKHLYSRKILLENFWLNRFSDCLTSELPSVVLWTFPRSSIRPKPKPYDPISIVQCYCALVPHFTVTSCTSNIYVCFIIPPWYHCTRCRLVYIVSHGINGDQPIGLLYWPIWIHF